MTSSISAPPRIEEEFKDLGFGAEGLTHKPLADSDAELLVLLIGTDETVSQTVHSRSSYKVDEIVWGAKFANMFLRTEGEGIVGMNLSRIHDIEMVYLR
jgi:inward rectifier potassium channel